MEFCVDGLLLLMAAVVMIFFYWWYLGRKARRKVIHVTRDRQAPLGVHVSKYTDIDNLLHLERLEPETADALQAGYPIASFEDYLSTLKIPDEVNTEEVVASLLDSFGYAFVLPLLEIFSPSGWRKERYGPLDFASSKYAHALLAFTSPLPATGLTTIWAKAKARGDWIDITPNPVKLMIEGDPVLAPGTLPLNLPSSVVLARDMHNIIVKQLNVDRHTPKEPLKPKRPVSARYFPDLYTGDGGLSTTYTPYELGMTRLFCMVLNKLAANLIPGPLMPPNTKRVPFEVRLTENDTEVHKTPESLLRALARTHSVSARVCSRMTSLGKTLCVAQPDGSFVNVPINVPMRSGVKMFGQTDWQDIILPTLHAEMEIDIAAGPVLSEPLRFVWFQSIDGFTGFFLRQIAFRPWQNGLEGTIKSHLKHDWSGEEFLQTIRLATALSLGNNIAASQTKLPKGGYGYTGLCIDGVACIQLAMEQRTSLYPLTITGEGKMDVIATLSQLIKHFEAESSDTGIDLIDACRTVDSCRTVIMALMNLPSDIVVEARNLEDTLNRMEASLPDRAMFGLVTDTKRDIAQVRAALASVLQPIKP